MVASPPQAHQLVKKDVTIEKDNQEPTEVQVPVQQTIYVEYSGKAEADERFMNGNAMRYDDKYRYPYHHHHPHHPSNSDKVDHIEQQAIIYEQAEAPSEQIHQTPGENSSEPKTHYTNLEPMSSQGSYYITQETYQTPSGNYAYLQGPPPKETYAVYHPSPNAVLYKDPPLSSSIAYTKQIHNPSIGNSPNIYENSVASSPGGQQSYSYWTGPPIDYNTVCLH